LVRAPSGKRKGTVIGVKRRTDEKRETAKKKEKNVVHLTSENDKRGSEEKKGSHTVKKP